MIIRNHFKLIAVCYVVASQLTAASLTAMYSTASRFTIFTQCLITPVAEQVRLLGSLP